MTKYLKGESNFVSLVCLSKFHGSVTENKRGRKDNNVCMVPDRKVNEVLIVNQVTLFKQQIFIFRKYSKPF